MELPECMQAVKARAPNDIFVDTSAKLPTVRPGYLIIKVSSVALNPSDWKGAAIFNQDVPHTFGLDAIGRVVECGEQIKQNYKPGDRVAGLCYGFRIGEPTSGAFGKYTLLKGALSMPIPDHVSDEEAATIPVGINAIGQALYQTLRIPLPELSGGSRPCLHPAILIYGGTTATGMFGLQFARLSGCRVLTTCSPRNFQLAKALGAHEAFDYHDAISCAAEIRAATGNGLLYALDCVAQGASLDICAGALTSRPNEAVYTAMLPVSGKFPRDDVRHGWTSGYTAFGEEYFFLGSPRAAKPEDLAFAAGFWELTAELLRQDRLRLGPLVHRRTGGLDGIPDGLAELREGRISAGKLVYTVDDPDHPVP